MRLLSFLVVGLILMFNVSAYTFIDIYLDDSGSALFLGGTDENVSFPEGIDVEDGEIVGKTNVLTDKNGEIWNFSYSLDDAELNLILPDGAIIKSIEYGEIFIKNKRIHVHSVSDVRLYYAIDERPSYFVLWGIGGFFVLIILVSFFYIGRKSKGSFKKKGIIVRDILGERENLILDKLKHTGRIKYSQLRKICDIPKASFSRHIQELERKKLLSRNGDGKNKFIELI